MECSRVIGSRTALLLLASIACVTLAGCSSGDNSHVSGVVTFDGNPAPNSVMTFVSLNQGPGGTAITDENGHYEAQMSLNNDWLAPGEYRVEIQGRADHLKADGLMSEIKPGDISLPKKYYGENSELRLKAEPGNATVNFDLTSN
ncbi:carboxypeptidase-like regulatory domain-containing protein [Blastopirellula sp. J2-11]|uniref:carboxypeptidase-like regulatory domain-containing protein n=1 Tax=Blastopirellula sp. J2-11 TaxID=2943192 RepID=UPI0021C6AEB4|nr:carboxypeptidase-like regulatory domain-containing protein [Blastopirellula sp. J2-11]UUO07212.1 carboxypeptidase-like regulatory domain-containing protein [Blastopirellula sp. J2-11]